MVAKFHPLTGRKLLVKVFRCFCASRRLHKCLWEGRWTRWILATTILAPLPLLAIQLPHSVAYTAFDNTRYAAFYVDVEWNKVRHRAIKGRWPRI